ncbi:hypothetical protein EC501_16820 [Lysinibacillus halotolerans]|uniref:Uncharacterized protein n=1 Tax=Lysinibacillus halotolerans TaxID=1368476 RepID=A0A3M8H1L7_9BACI|nr:hypothetical protein EC501_16820 [Lysinibacillus halotolerans]
MLGEQGLLKFSGLFLYPKSPQHTKAEGLVGAFKNKQKYRRKNSRSGRTEENKESRRPEAQCDSLHEHRTDADDAVFRCVIALRRKRRW